MTGADAIAVIVLLTILVAVGVYLLHWLYRHSSKDEAFVRTGLGGEKVVMGGGAFVIPIVHDITRVNMNTVPIEIRRAGEGSLITRNKMRVDVISEFSVRVIPTKESVSRAALTFGERIYSPEQMKDLVQGRFVDAISAVAATMTMDEIHTSRKQFMRQVSELVAPMLTPNGLELENASLTSLNQTDISVFNPDNAFDAEGLTQLTEEIEERRKLRNRIEDDPVWRSSSRTTRPSSVRSRSIVISNTRALIKRATLRPGGPRNSPQSRRSVQARQSVSATRRSSRAGGRAHPIAKEKLIECRTDQQPDRDSAA